MTTLPPEIKSLIGLERLTLDYNQFTTFPEEIGNLVGLEKLEIGNNKLTALSPKVGNLSELKELHAQCNQLATIPLEIVNLTRLTLLGIRNNPLKTLPKGIATSRNPHITGNWEVKKYFQQVGIYKQLPIGALHDALLGTDEYLIECRFEALSKPEKKLIGDKVEKL